MANETRKYVVLEAGTGHVTNMVSWNGINPWQPPGAIIEIPMESQIDQSWMWDGVDFVLIDPLPGPNVEGLTNLSGNAEKKPDDLG